MDPQQELFTKLFMELKKLRYGVYDGFLPKENTPYPFIYLADSQLTDDSNKSAVFGNVFQTIHVWSDSPRSRGTLSKILLSIKDVLRKIDRTDNFSWSVLNIDQRIFTDNTTKTPLLHGVIYVEYKFS